MKKSLLSLLLALPFLFASTSFAQAKQDFQLVNKTGVEIHRVYISANDDNQWGEDILGKDVMALDEEWEISFAPVENVCLWDIRIEDQDGNYITWDNIDLCKWTVITLYFDGTDATATFE